MKNTSTFLARIAVVAVITCAPACAFAVARAPFPNSHALQPPPPNIRPDISGNVSRTPYPVSQTDNSTVTPAPLPIQADNETDQSSDDQTSPFTFSDSSLATWVTYASLLLIAAVLIYKIVRD